MPDRAVGAVGAAVRVGARDELAGQHQPLLGEVEVEDAVAGRRRSTASRCRAASANCAPDRRLLVVGVLAGEDEVVVGDRRLARVDRVAAGDLVEGVDGERRRAVGGRQQVGVDAQRRARRRPRRPCRRGGPRRSARWSSCARARRRRRATRSRGARSTDARNSRRPTAKMPPAAADLVFLGGQRQRRRRSCPASRWRAARVAGSKVNSSPSLRVGHRLGALHDVQPEVERVAAEDVAHVVAADDDQLEADLLGDGLEARRAHLARASRWRSGRRR